MSPLHQVHRKAPPFLLVQGSKDALIPLAEPQAFQQRLRDAGASAALLQLPEVEHAFDLFPTRPTRQALPVLTAWLNALVTRSG
jgi:acetyl esterase/lipase